MEKKTKKPDTTKLAEIIKKWKINMPVLAKSIGMSETAFKKKLSENFPYYSFSEWEIFSISITVSTMVDDLCAFSQQQTKEYFKNNPSGKVKNYPEK